MLFCGFQQSSSGIEWTAFNAGYKEKWGVLIHARKHDGTIRKIRQHMPVLMFGLLDGCLGVFGALHAPNWPKNVQNWIKQ